jgi:hypothetical protein
VEDVHGKYGRELLHGYPDLRLDLWMEWMLIDKIKRFRPLYYTSYPKTKVKAMLHDRYGWNPYEGFHAENLLTHFLISYYMPVKFGIDLRRVTHSAMIRSGQMAREDALKDLSRPPAIALDTITEVKRRLNISDEEFVGIMGAPKHSANDFKTYRPVFKAMSSFFHQMYREGLVPETFVRKYCQ